jgi:transcriptional regulator with XRE-family HTH domain
MSAAQKLLDKAAENCSPANQSGLALRLGVTRSLISSWKTGVFGVPAERIAELARIGHVDAGEWLILIEAEQAGGEARKAYGSLAKRLGLAALLALLAAPALASQSAAGSPAFRINPAYCLLCSSVRRLMTRLRAICRAPLARIADGHMLALQG